MSFAAVRGLTNTSNETGRNRQDRKLPGSNNLLSGYRTAMLSRLQPMPPRESRMKSITTYGVPTGQRDVEQISIGRGVLVVRARTYAGNLVGRRATLRAIQASSEIAYRRAVGLSHASPVVRAVFDDGERRPPLSPIGPWCQTGPGLATTGVVRASSTGDTGEPEDGAPPRPVPGAARRARLGTW